MFLKHIHKSPICGIYSPHSGNFRRDRMLSFAHHHPLCVELVRVRIFSKGGEIAIFRSIPTARQKSKRATGHSQQTNPISLSQSASRTNVRRRCRVPFAKEGCYARFSVISPHYCRQLWMTLTISFVLFSFSFGEFRFFFYSIDRARTLINIFFLIQSNKKKE